MLAASICGKGSILRSAWTDRRWYIIGSQRVWTLSWSSHDYLQHLKREEDDNRFYALILNRRRASFGESALALSVVVISIYFLTQMANNILLSIRRLQFRGIEHVYSSSGTSYCWNMLPIEIRYIN